MQAKFLIELVEIARRRHIILSRFRYSAVPPESLTIGVPALVDFVVQGKMPVERVATFYPFADINRAAASSAGESIQNRVADPEEVAAPVLFLLSDDASFITGSQLVPDGGMTAI